MGWRNELCSQRFRDPWRILGTIGLLTPADTASVLLHLGLPKSPCALDSVAAMCHDSAASAITSATRQFTGYGTSHWVVLAIFAIGSAALIWIGRSQSEPQARVLGRILGALTAALYAALLIYKLHSSTIVDAVPLQLSDLAPFVAAYAWWSHRHWAFALTYYWGLVLSSQALITPVFNGPDFPNYKFLVFWALHLLVVWAAIYLTWGRRMRPSCAVTASR
jgi:uncharacterized membrane protein YwaF